MIPAMFSITEESCNYYPYTITTYSCGFLPRLEIKIETCFRDDGGTCENALDISEEELKVREVTPMDIVTQPCSERHYKESEDLTKFKSTKTGYVSDVRAHA